MANNDLAVVILNFNKKDLVLKCIESIFQSDYMDFDVIVVDNASTDGSAEAVAEKYGNKLTLIINPENVGGSGGFYRGMKHVMERGFYRYLIQFDNDITIKNDTIYNLRTYMDLNSDVGVCGAAIFQSENPELTQEMGANISFDEFTNKPLFFQVKADELPTEIECDYAPIGSAIIRTSVIAKIGLIESGYFIYWDDMEFCWRVRNSGYKVRAISSAIVYHDHGFKHLDTTIGVYYFFRNKVNCFARHVNDDEFQQLPEIITKRVYRTMVCNRNNMPIATAYMHALNDALYGIMGKADEYKIRKKDNADSWCKILKNKSSILIKYDPVFRRIEELVSLLRKYTSAGIYVHAKSEKDITFLSCLMLGNAMIITDDSSDEWNVEISVCDHVLDISYEDIIFVEGQNLIYDNYGDTCSDENDFRAYMNYFESYDVFRAMMYNFITDKLKEIRNKWKNHNEGMMV